ncbi:hypothetical protein TSAR_010973 [Trichomalopsis sarcophagae]|uniref:Uncharacterized protein n=1 Tax=Trichomalopsis sarcophagae TaxID=543379 RepID=A0A232EDE0_9HYME|nr:hypothetical protein TSAR_010973 [Trichomalopsis sarcophagae]
MMGRIRYACLITKDDPKNRYCKPIDVIYRSKRDKQHIFPSDARDFDKNHTYSVYWRVCKKNCKVEDKCCSFYKAYIISLGESEEDALKAAANRTRRFRFVKKFESSDTNESTVEEFTQQELSSD